MSTMEPVVPSRHGLKTASSTLKHVAEVITNIFENSEEAFAYDAIEDIGDARGYTAGRVGFTTGTGDVQALVELYNRMSKSSQAKALAGYLPELTRLSSLSRCDPARASVDGLKGFDTAWKNAAHKDPEFARAQDTLNEQMYLTPGRRYAALNNVTSPLGQAIFYDTIIQHGWQITEPDINLPRILTLTGPRQKEESEAAYLGRFLHTRRTLLCCYPDNTWPKAADRISDLQSVLKAGGLFMRKTIHLPSYNKNVKVPKQKGLRLRI
ncbi:MAG: lysozyme-like domain-containing protein [Piptocephalis tieghemiana]|nr:MAG: lysozyme-like domain-containing protein [Piptocephalis tieghemiana]